MSVCLWCFARAFMCDRPEINPSVPGPGLLRQMLKTQEFLSRQHNWYAVPIWGNGRSKMEIFCVVRMQADISLKQGDNSPF